MGIEMQTYEYLWVEEITGRQDLVAAANWIVAESYAGFYRSDDDSQKILNYLDNDSDPHRRILAAFGVAEQAHAEMLATGSFRLPQWGTEASFEFMELALPPENGWQELQDFEHCIELTRFAYQTKLLGVDETSRLLQRELFIRLTDFGATFGKKEKCETAIAILPKHLVRFLKSRCDVKLTHLTTIMIDHESEHRTLTPDYWARAKPALYATSISHRDCVCPRTGKHLRI